ncbi:hypothetical protein [Laspinema palackyanum]|uniref:hypothetical protein n=1 Tax=Laspinema palackyanum TaxID=3231601 RepID=UPI00345CCC6B|nr:hypothetical protein [Laspinema sp. D2c]
MKIHEGIDAESPEIKVRKLARLEQFTEALSLYSARKFLEGAQFCEVELGPHSQNK